MKHLLFEDNGDFRAGTVMSESGSNLQVELASGKRSKVKASHVVLRYDSPAPEALIPEARELAEAIDVDFLWECAPQDEFDFGTLANEYFGGQASPQQATALLLRLHTHPVYFHRKGRGRYRPASPETLRAALAALERKRTQEAQIEAESAAMIAGELPPAVRREAARLLVRPDKNSLTWKAFDRAIAATGKTPERLLLELGAFESARALHVERFVTEHFPHGLGFAPGADSLDGLGAALEPLPLADVEAFSIDDSTTTEIDDCLSVRRIEGGWRIGVHIAAPGLGIEPGSFADREARERMSTVYMPGDKITMLPEGLVKAYSLDAGREMPALSLYVDTDESAALIVGQYTQAERVRIAANLRQDLLDGVYDEALLCGDAQTPIGQEPPAFVEALRVLWKLTNALSAERDRVRGRPEARSRADFSFYLDPPLAGANHEPSVRIVQRRRDAPLDRIVAEMAILANSEWGRLLAEHDLPGVYRSQQAGRVRVTSHPLPHQGLGVQQYMWSTSPLRRYVDLVNQRQVLAAISGQPAPYSHKDSDLFAMMSAFDAKYTAYADFQQRMERYWCLRWVEQQSIRKAAAVIVREDLVRLRDAPLYIRIPQLPMLAPGQPIRIEILAIDELDLSVQARFLDTIDSEAAQELPAPPPTPEQAVVEGG